MSAPSDSEPIVKPITPEDVDAEACDRYAVEILENAQCAIQSAPSKRKRAIAITKIDEAIMWLQRKT